MPAEEIEPLLGTRHFRVLIGRREIGFSEVSGLTSATYAAERDNREIHRFATVVLRRALTSSRDLYEWRRRYAGGRKERRTVTIQQLDGPRGRVVNSWQLEGAWPRRWSGPSFNATANDIAMEEIEIDFDDLVWVEGPGAQTSLAPPAAPRRRISSKGG